MNIREQYRFNEDNVMKEVEEIYDEYNHGFEDSTTVGVSKSTLLVLVNGITNLRNLYYWNQHIDLLEFKIDSQRVVHEESIFTVLGNKLGEVMKSKEYKEDKEMQVSVNMREVHALGYAVLYGDPDFIGGMHHLRDKPRHRYFLRQRLETYLDFLDRYDKQGGLWNTRAKYEYENVIRELKRMDE